MLVLQRRLEEEIRIGDDVVVKVLRIERGYVKLGVSAPAGVVVDRQEVSERRRCRVVSQG